MMIDIIYTHFDKMLENGKWDEYLNKVSEHIQNKILRYRQWQDRYAALLGKLLLIQGLRRFGYSPDFINNLKFNEYGRPFIDSRVDFNISHSNEYVVCSITDKGRVGIDIEKIRPIELSDFERYLTAEQCKAIQESDNRYKKFYEYWTMKESVIKADGRGLSVPFSDIHIEDKNVILDNNTWFLKEIRINSNYSCHTATNIKSPDFNIREKTFYDTVETTQ